MSWHDEREYWNGGDKYAWFGFGMNDFNLMGKRSMQPDVLPVHVDHPAGGSNSVVKAAPEGSCEGDGQDHTDD